MFQNVNLCILILFGNDLSLDNFFIFLIMVNFSSKL